MMKIKVYYKLEFGGSWQNAFRKEQLAPPLGKAEQIAPRLYVFCFFYFGFLVFLVFLCFMFRYLQTKESEANETDIDQLCQLSDLNISVHCSNIQNKTFKVDSIIRTCLHRYLLTVYSSINFRWNWSNFCSQLLFNSVQVESIIVSNHTDCQSTMSKSARSTNAM